MKEASISSEASHDDVSESSGSRSSITIPGPYQFAGNTTLEPANNSEELLARYPQEDQQRIRAYYEKFGEGPFNLTEYAVKDVFSFRTVEQLRWLLSHGYPTPDDVLAAESLTDEELGTLASAGNVKAIAFYLERVSTQDVTASADAANHPEFSEVRFRAQLEDRLLSTGSPFSAYVMARQAISNDQKGMALAAYFFADRLGDTRGGDFAVQFSGTHDVDAREALISFMALQARAGAQNPLLNDLRFVGSRPRFPKWD